MAGTYEHVVVVILILIGIVGGSALALLTNAPPILVAILVSFGVAAAIYSYFGGIDKTTSFAVGSLKLGGVMAAVVGTACLVNHYMVEQRDFRAVTTEALVGEWTWDYPKDRWRATLRFEEEKGGLVFRGNVEQFQDDGSLKIIYEMRDGTAKILNRKHLELQCKVRDLIHNRDFVWKTAEPLKSGLAFEGSFRVDMRNQIDHSLENLHWGISLLRIID